jgi:hypothetical protein
MVVSYSPKNKSAVDKNKRGNVLYVYLNIEARSCSHCCFGKAIIIRHSECVFVALVTQHAMHCACALLSSLAGPALHYFSTVYDKRHDLRERERESESERETLNIKCVLIFSTTFV